jgi:hypothetical protein
MGITARLARLPQMTMAATVSVLVVALGDDVVEHRWGQDREQDQLAGQVTIHREERQHGQGDKEAAQTSRSWASF